ncbi:class I SAM-dependent methyltransferase [Pelotomaculum propionicicum]|uniref:S-adenosyl-L-methionine-dependent methyltransferase n=1 Tax=Pelotomaculum propionicicum TaxID=258475 RepID=A0A4Y7RLX9_9FIRM|nr:class I SAM-dependent methyltransferase [Pelotomaculum propionicicum]NLI12920.1 class I SAM-dependent methyltransferase [Peptococcaceae bacterium]TEB09821.1 hypothetical protein Pmgp_02822 [Pelotomaculum propionicicum]
MKVNLSNVQKTLLLPLWGRAKLTKVGNPLLSDPKAVEIVEQIDYDFAGIEKIFTDFFNIGWITRAKMFDETIKCFLAKDPGATVVNIGAGLDTTFFRVDNGQLRWYDLDLPDVIEIRKKIFPESNRSRCLAKSLFDPDWVKEITTGAHNVLFLAGGVLFYFKEAEIKKLFKLLADSFPGGEIVFDTVAEFSIPIINKGMQEAGHETALVKWGVNDAETLSQWDQRIIVLEDYPLFSRIENRDYWGEKIALYMNQSDNYKASSIFHLKFAG